VNQALVIVELLCLSVFVECCHSCDDVL